MLIKVMISMLEDYISMVKRIIKTLDDQIILCVHKVKLVSLKSFITDKWGKRIHKLYLLQAIWNELEISKIKKMAVFWVVALCSLVEVYRRFRGICCLHYHTRRHENLKSHKSD
jgi:hypothetical protein